MKEPGADRQAQVLNVGTAKYQPNLKQRRRAVIARQTRVCATPGRNHTHLEIHHVIWWGHTGGLGILWFARSGDLVAHPAVGRCADRLSHDRAVRQSPHTVGMGDSRTAHQVAWELAGLPASQCLLVRPRTHVGSATRVQRDRLTTD
jgi:hypothetical protein